MMNVQKPTRCLAIFAALICGFAGGCSSDGLPDDAGAVQGAVTYQGGPLADAVVTFRSQSGFSAVAKTDQEGRYQLSSPNIPGGTKIGPYQVTVVKREPLQNVQLTEEDPNYSSQLAQSAPKPAKFLVPERYSRPETSGLEATVTTGVNEINFDLAD